MVSSKKLIYMARKWKKLAMISRKRITFDSVVTQGCETSLIDKGYFVLYTTDQRRFAFPLCYFNTGIFKKLLEMAEEEYGHQNEGPITLPCDSMFLEYLISMIRRRVPKDLERALLMTMTSDRYFSTVNVLDGLNQHQLPICSF